MPPALLPIFPGKIEHDATNGNLQQQRSANRAQADALLFTDNTKGNCQQYHHPHNTSHYIHNDFPFMPVNPASAPGFGMFDEYGRRLSARQKLTHETLIFFGNFARQNGVIKDQLNIGFQAITAC